MKQHLLLVKYDSNNSGGSWWLTDNDWVKLEKAGWEIDWAKDEKPTKDCEYCKGTGKLVNIKKFNTGSYKKGDKCFMCLHAKDGRYHGGLAKSAKLTCKTIKEALESFEKETGQSVTDEGCNCCGSPHSFTWSSVGCTSDGCKCKNEHEDYNYGSGEDLAQYLYGDDGTDVPKDYREALKIIREMKKK